MNVGRASEERMQNRCLELPECRRVKGEDVDAR